MPEQDLVPARRIAREIGVAPQTIERAALRGHIRYQQVLDVVRFSASDARRYFGSREAAV